MTAAQNVPARGNVTSGVDRILSMPRASVYALAATTVATGGAFNAVLFDTLEYDTDGMFTAGVTTGFFLTCRTAGLYKFTAWCWWAANGTGFREVAFSKNGGVVLYADQPSATPSAGSACGQLIAADIPLNAGDRVSFAVAQTSGGNLDVLASPSGADRRNGFQACLISTF